VTALGALAVVFLSVALCHAYAAVTGTAPLTAAAMALMSATSCASRVTFKPFVSRGQKVRVNQRDGIAEEFNHLRGQEVGLSLSLARVSRKVRVQFTAT
jgi:hypothetical protein